MKNVSTLNALPRKKVGTNSAKKVREKDQIPAIIYGDGIKPEPVSLNVTDLRAEINKSAFLNKIYDIAVDKNKVRVIVQDVSQNPVTDQLEHIDFLRVNDKTKVTIEVPVNFINENLSPGIKRGGVLNVVRYTVEVICPVNKIPEKFEFNLEGLEIGDSIHISHTKIEEGVETTIKDRDFTVASILAPSALVSSESTEEKTEEEEEGKEEDKAEESKTEDKESK
ncbi:MAG: 50S ribosomal protein L25/general stress protein Ctc [Rickettsiales bacterium]|nr:50S ribosomal protein L25/general stress protein Ctc [Rickettsiales bacterium]|tara:strand:+ start:956 stop:1627 length:672 start_codon:yes stop_codon:yes gene_type:complete